MIHATTGRDKINDQQRVSRLLLSHAVSTVVVRVIKRLVSWIRRTNQSNCITSNTQHQGAYSAGLCCSHPACDLQQQKLAGAPLPLILEDLEEFMW